METQTKYVKDLKVALKDIEPAIKDPKFLRTGREIKNFTLRPREFWANWLICAVLQKVTGRKFTPAESDEGDGILLDQETMEGIKTEHVSALEVPSPKALTEGEDRILGAIVKKIARGPEYAQGKTLVVFSEGAGWWYPNRVGREILGKHKFDAVYCIDLASCESTGYTYTVSKLGKEHSPSWRVEINADFTDWCVLQIQ